MGWERDMLKLMQEKGYNTDVRVLEGIVSSTSPLTFRPFGFDVEMNARFAESVATGAAEGQTVLAIQDMTTRSCYVIARLV